MPSPLQSTISPSCLAFQERSGWILFLAYMTAPVVCLPSCLIQESECLKLTSNCGVNHCGLGGVQEI
ncbi:hypothetical protein BGZ63DRAFT_376352 [Mariannaea sp. PMI_226]|nr:hypothetical protein BGZ63DRAFT_376352 [Mariannaea sp. PMI_226]